MSERYDALQALRAFAAGLVVYQHSFSNWAEKGVRTGQESPHVAHLGELGVMLFFCISGFIMVHSTQGLEQGWASTRAFLVRRLHRIAPLYWLVTTAYLLKNALAQRTSSVEEVLKSFLFIPHLNSDGLVQPVLGLGWSLNHEMFFYVVFGALLLLPRLFHTAALAVVMASLAMARATGWLGSTSAPNALFYWADLVILYFVAGVLLGQLAIWWRRRSLPALSQQAAISASVLILLGYGGVALRLDEAAALPWLPLAAILPVVACVLTRPGAGHRWLAPLTLAGDASYSTYLTHGLFMGALARVLVQLGQPIGFYGFAALSLVVCTAAGILVYFTVEKPLLRWTRVSRLPRGMAEIQKHPILARMAG
jgi:exopolysaccharide production protein ExoZ